MNRDDDQELWDLLGKSQPPAVSPFFARNVVREIRQASSRPSRWRQWLTIRTAIPAAVVALALSTAVVFKMSVPQHAPDADRTQDDIPEVVAQIDPSDYEVVADLDDLLASQEDDSWDETSTL